MEPLDVNWMDELLRDFSGDVILPAPRSSSSRRHHHRGAGAGAAPPSQEERRRQSPPAWSAPIVHPSLLDGPATDPSPGFVEEELEWLSNKEAFPSLETFDVYAYREPSSPAPPPPLAAAEGGSKRPSPVSVLAKGFLPAASPFLQRTPRRARSQGQQRRRRVLPVFPSSRSSPGEEKRRCWHCGAGETPQWRAGPHGPKTLCNACGVRYKSGRLVPEYRPASSPTFSSALHSNSHRKIMEMRRRKEGQAHSAAGGGGAAPTTANKKKKKKRKRKGLRLL